jgi:hypothetical protein
MPHMSGNRIVVAKVLRSRTGWAFAAAYLIPAVFFLWDGVTCVGMLCDLPAFLVLLPTGWAYYMISNFFFGYAPDPLVGWGGVGHDLHRFIKWGFIIPSVLMNVILCYCVGYLMGRFSKRFLIRKGPH